MTAHAPLHLYMRPDCHLCDHVAAMLRARGQDWVSVNIDEDEELESYYGLTIPVLRCPAREKELHFPFGETRLEAFLRECGLIA